jgi:hypothetical protein
MHHHRIPLALPASLTWSTQNDFINIKVIELEKSIWRIFGAAHALERVQNNVPHTPTFSVLSFPLSPSA